MRHFIFKKEINFLENSKLEQAMFGMGCFWGAERKYWNLEGVKLTAVGYAGGVSKSPSYQDVCSGLTGHNEVVKLLFDPTEVSYAQLLAIFWENHDPTQKNRQGNDIGTQYRSGAYYFSKAQKGKISETKEIYEQSMRKVGFGAIVTEIEDAPEFFLAEDYHQQYLAKNPQGYCGLGGTGISLTMKSENLIEAL
jgi:peptide-methionine (S)-S-oxide reductase